METIPVANLNTGIFKSLKKLNASFLIVPDDNLSRVLPVLNKTHFQGHKRV